MTEEERRNLHDKRDLHCDPTLLGLPSASRVRHRIRNALGHALNGQDNGCKTSAGVASGLYAALMNVIFLAQRIGTPLAL